MIRWFRQYWAITRNAFVVSLSDPVYLILVLSVLTLMAFFAALPTFNFGQELRLVRDQSMALIFIGGCFVAGLGTVTVVTRDVRQGAISVLMSRPVSSLSVIAGKWTGLAGAILVYHIPATLGCLWITRIAGGEYAQAQHLDNLSLAIYFTSLILALGLMGLKHYFFGGCYVWQASLAILAFFAVGFVIANCFGPHGGVQSWGAEINWRTANGCLLLFFAELIFAALLLPFAVKLDVALVLGVGVVLFFFGMISNYLVNNLLDPGILYSFTKSLLPNWQTFWISDLLAGTGKLAGGKVARYAGSCLIHTAAYIVACLAVATWLFDRREFYGGDTL